MINLKISPQAKRVHLPEVVGKGYGTFWNFKGRYRVCKGSRASKKSKTTALNIIKRMMQYPEANTLVVRKVFRTLKDSCFTELKWAINRLGVSAYWEIKESPLEMTYLPTGQKIYFRGLDDPLNPWRYPGRNRPVQANHADIQPVERKALDQETLLRGDHRQGCPREPHIQVP